MKLLGTIKFSESQRAAFRSGQLAAEWAERYKWDEVDRWVKAGGAAESDKRDSG